MYFAIDNNHYTGYYKNTGNQAIPNDIDNYVSENLVAGIKIPDSKIYSIRITRNADIPNFVNWVNVRSFTFKRTPGSGMINTQEPAYLSFVKDGYFICKSPFEQTVKIYDARGEMRKKDRVGLDRKVDIRSLEAGLYIVKGDNFTQKIMIR